MIIDFHIHIGDFRTVTETNASLAALATTTPTLATWTDIGDSWLKVNSAGAGAVDQAGNDLFVLVLTNQPGGVELARAAMGDGWSPCGSNESDALAE